MILNYLGIQSPALYGILGLPFYHINIALHFRLIAEPREVIALLNLQLL